MAFHFQDEPVIPTAAGLSGGATGNIAQGTAAEFTFPKRVGLVELQNDSDVDLWYRWENAITDSGTDNAAIAESHGVLKAGSFMSFVRLHTSLSLFNKTGSGTNVEWTGSAAEKKLWVNGYYEE